MRSIRTYLGAVVLAAIALPAFAAEPGVDDAKRLATFRAGVAACISDRVRLCPDVTPGEGRIVACLAAHTDQLNPVCAVAMERGSEALMALARAMRPNPMVKTSTDRDSGK